MSDHIVTVEFDQWGTTNTLRCTAPADALCRARYTCECEEWSEEGLIDGFPVHTVQRWDEATDEDVEDSHVGRFDPEYCNLREWFENTDEPLSGQSTFSVTAEWQGDHYSFHPAKEKAS